MKISEMPIKPKKNKIIHSDKIEEPNIKLVFNNELPQGLNPNSVLTPKQMNLYFNYSVRTLGNYRTYYAQDQKTRVGPKWQRRGVQTIVYLVKDVIRCHEGLQWSEPYPATFASVKPSKKKKDQNIQHLPAPANFIDTKRYKEKHFDTYQTLLKTFQGKSKQPNTL